ncbi:hypothetical protein Tco_0194674 [Tanacetum coccineum]
MTHKLDNMIELPELQSKETYKEDLECKMVMVEMPRCMSWLGSTNAYDERIGSLGMMDNELVTYPKEVEETLGTSMEVEPLDHIKLEDVGLDTCNHDIPISSREVPSFDELEPQPQPLPNCLSLDISLGEERSSEPPIKTHSPDSFRMKVIDPLTIHTPPSPHVASFHLKDMYCYYHPCIDNPKKYYGFKPSLLGQSGSLGVDFSNSEIIEDDFLGVGLSLPIKTNRLGKYRIKETHHLEHIIQQPLFNKWLFLTTMSSLAMTHKLDDIIELPKSQPKKTYEEDLEYEMVMVKMPSPQSTPQVLLSFEEYTPPVTYRKEVEKTLKPLMEEESLNQTQLEDVGFDSYDYNFSLSSREVLSVDNGAQSCTRFSILDVIFDKEKPGSS